MAREPGLDDVVPPRRAGFADGRRNLYQQPVLGHGAHRFAVAVVVAAAVAASLGCGGAGERTEATSERSPLTGAELGWLRSYAAWTFALLDDELGPPPGPGLVEACREKLELAGTPPTERLRPAAERAASACPLLSHRGSYRRALDVVDASDDLLRPLLLDSRPLPLSSAATKDSRADIALSAFASEKADQAIEVRCWGADDWERVVSEDNAWFDENEDPADLVGWQVDDAGRIHMRLEQCNAIVQLQRTDVLELDRDEQVETADSLDTITHEIQHFLLPDADEAGVQCAAEQSLGEAARRLGASRTEAAALVRLYRTELRPDLPDEYVEGGCK